MIKHYFTSNLINRYCASDKYSDDFMLCIRNVRQVGFHAFFFRYTCVYLACKVEEFNVSIQQFVANCHGDKEKAADIILSHELLLMHELQYHLTVHNPFRPLEGLLIDIKVRIVCEKNNITISISYVFICS